MPTVHRQKLRKPTRRFDMAALREALADGKVHVSLAVVVQDGSTHFEVVEGADVLVDVELHPSGVRCSARLAGSGIYAIPPVGAEVVVLVPDGELEAGPVIVSRTGEAPDGLNPTTLIIVAPAGGQVLVHDGAAADAQVLALKTDVDALKTTVAAHKTVFDAHVHILTLTSGTGTAAIPALPMATPADPVGTAVLRAK